MNEDFTRGKCPICGQSTIFRLNKNGILYTYCINSHHAKLSQTDSKSARMAIEQGKAWNNGIVHLYPLTQQQHQDTKGTENGTNTFGRRATDDTGANTSTTNTSRAGTNRNLDIGFF